MAIRFRVPKGTPHIKISRKSRGSGPEPGLDVATVVVAVIVIAIIIALLT